MSERHCNHIYYIHGCSVRHKSIINYRQWHLGIWLWVTHLEASHFVRRQVSYNPIQLRQRQCLPTNLICIHRVVGYVKNYVRRFWQVEDESLYLVAILIYILY